MWIRQEGMERKLFISMEWNGKEKKGLCFTYQKKRERNGTNSCLEKKKGKGCGVTFFYFTNPFIFSLHLYMVG